MIQLMEGLPQNVIGVEATEKVSREDYEKVLMPEVEKRFKEFKKIRFLYHLGENFKGFTSGAIWDDFKVGTAHYSAWEKCAIVTDSHWISGATHLMKFLIPCEVKVFKNSELDEAKKWITA